MINNSGIYKITNKINNKVYYGSASITFKTRWHTHVWELNNNRHHCYNLQNDWNNYGKDTFEFTIIEIIERKSLTKEQFRPIILAIEQKYINKYWDNGVNCYNIEKIAGSQLGIKRSDETRKKISLSKIGKPSPRKNVKLSDETKSKISQNHADMSGTLNPMYGKKHSDEARVKISQNHANMQGENNPMYGIRKGQTWKLINGKRVWSVQSND